MGSSLIKGSWSANDTSDKAPCAKCGVTIDTCDYANHINVKTPSKKIYYFYHLSRSEQTYSYSIGSYKYSEFN